jgi:hypothetical protein
MTRLFLSETKTVHSRFVVIKGYKSQVYNLDTTKVVSVVSTALTVENLGLTAHKALIFPYMFWV